MLFKKKINLICGHYGCGKTNLSLNLALMAAEAGEKVTLVDLDLVNPYFRSSDYAEQLKNSNIKVIAPVYANSNVDIPSLPAEINSIFSTDDMVIMDIGGDDVGATVLGRFSRQFENVDYDLYYVVNHYRNLTSEPEEAVQILREIQQVSHLKPAAIINNSHLKADTTAEVILDSMDFARKVCELTELPLVAVTAPKVLATELEEELGDLLLPIDILVKTGWE